MTAILTLIVFLVVVALAARYGTDSRGDRPGRQF
jgi:hypothetical protein